MNNTNALKWINSKIFLLLLWLIVGSISTVWILQINRDEKEHINLLQQNLVQNAMGRFDDIVVVRQWNAGHGGVYIKQHDGLQPNPYLKDNLAYTDKNEKLIKVNPAWMTRQISEISNAKRAEKYNITSLKPINPSNAPDQFEAKALKYLEKNRSKHYYYQFDDDHTFRFLGALYVEAGCLKCHAEQGYSIGDVRGGIRISLPLEGYAKEVELIEAHSQRERIGAVIVGLVIGSLLSLLIRLIIRHQRNLLNLNSELEKTVEKRTFELQELNNTLAQKVEEEISKNKDNEEMMILQSRHAAMGEMIGMIAHQWRQPISTVSMIANKMVMDIELDEVDMKSFEKDMEEIIADSEYLSKTIDDFANFLKPNKEKESFVPLNILNDALDIIKKSLENHSIVLTVTCNDENEVVGYPRELLQVYLNLLNNSKEALLRSASNDRWIKIDIWKENDRIITKICDNGGGIKPEILEKIFIPYFTTKEEFNGTGLGLYMSKIIVENHFLGNIRAEVDEKITCFFVSLPLMQLS